jgi:uncharacterized protein (DUF2141 family)
VTRIIVFCQKSKQLQNINYRQKNLKGFQTPVCRQAGFEGQSLGINFIDFKTTSYIIINQTIMSIKTYLVLFSFLIVFKNGAMVYPMLTVSASSEATAGGPAADTSHACVSFSITNIRNYKSPIYLAFYKDPSTFLKKGKETFSRAVTPTEAKTQVFKVCDVPPGTYAVAVMQDVHHTGDMKTDGIGLPEDPYGFSNTTRSSLLPPSFKKSSFTVAHGKEATIAVRLINP